MSGSLGTMLVQILFMLVPFGLIVVLSILAIRFLARNSKKKAHWQVTSSDGLVWIADGESRTLTAYQYDQETGQIKELAKKRVT